MAITDDLSSAQTEYTLGDASRARGLRLPPIGVELDLRQRLACAFRVLAGEGLSEGFNGHITVDDEAGGFLVNPWGYWWDEVRASHLCVISPDGDVVKGDLDVTPAVHIHTEVHRANPAAKVVIHNHPYYATLLASMGVLPDIVTQSACLLDGEIASFDDFTGPVTSQSLGRQLADQVGAATTTMLWSHGVLVTGPTIEEATFRLVTLERAARMTYDMMVVDKGPLPISPAARAATKHGLITLGVEGYWVGAVRRLLRDEPEVLS
ncbi:MAG: class II aldolase/adducin family protein [Acidimicrobiia bacterium]